MSDSMSVFQVLAFMHHKKTENERERERRSILLHHPAKSEQKGRSSSSVSLPRGRRVLRFKSKGEVFYNFRSMFLPSTSTSTSLSFFPPPFSLLSLLSSLLVIYPPPFPPVVLRVEAMAGETVFTDGVPACL